MASARPFSAFHTSLLITLSACVLGTVALMVYVPLNKTSQAPTLITKSAPAPAAPLPVSTHVTDTAFPASFQSNLKADLLRIGYEKLDYSLDGIAQTSQQVPALFLQHLPHDLKEITASDERKALFLQTLLPLVLKINQELKEDRTRIHALIHRRSLGLAMTTPDLIWLQSQFSRYKVSFQDYNTLLTRLDQIPPSLALAQAAEESGWGTSRFARLGNALFGQWTFNPKDKGIVPRGRAKGKTHRIKAYDNIEGSLRDYALNLNTHRAYSALRQKRADLRKKRLPLSGHTLAATLDKYSERGTAYITSLHGLMEANNLALFDQVQLDPTPVTLPDVLKPFI